MTATGATERTRELAQTALLAATCAAIGYALAIVPNVELISAATFTCGAFVGVRRGALVGALAEAVYAGFNPNGVSPPPIYAAQVLGFTMIGAAGGAARRFVGASGKLRRCAAAGCCGLVLTLVYDVLTNVAVWITVREQAALPAVVLGGLTFPFPLAHVLVNTVTFAVVPPAVLRALERWRTA